jgi:hypothetical protein
LRLLIPLLLAGSLAGQEKPEFTFGTTVVSTTGLQGKVFALHDSTYRLPRLDRLKAQGSIYTNTLNVWPQEFNEGFPGLTDRYEFFAIDYTGKFWIEQPGPYRFSLLSDDGAKLDIDGKELIDNDGNHLPQALTGSAVLSRGVHTIRVQYYQGPRYTVALVLAVAPPGGAWKIFNTEDFLPPSDPTLWVNGVISRIRRAVAPEVDRR